MLSLPSVCSRNRDLTRYLSSPPTASTSSLSSFCSLNCDLTCHPLHFQCVSVHPPCPHFVVPTDLTCHPLLLQSAPNEPVNAQPLFYHPWKPLCTSTCPSSM